MGKHCLRLGSEKQDTLPVLVVSWSLHPCRIMEFGHSRSTPLHTLCCFLLRLSISDSPAVCCLLRLHVMLLRYQSQNRLSSTLEICLLSRGGHCNKLSPVNIPQSWNYVLKQLNSTVSLHILSHLYLNFNQFDGYFLWQFSTSSWHCLLKSSAKNT